MPVVREVVVHCSLLRVALAALFLSFMSAAALAAADPAADYRDQVRPDDRLLIQYLLMWTGDYGGNIDGQFGDVTFEAIRSFQERGGYNDDSYLDVRQMDGLVKAAEAEIARVGYAPVADETADLVVRLPTGLLTEKATGSTGTIYRSKDGDLEVETIRPSSAETSLVTMYRQKREAVPKENLRQNVFLGNNFILAWTEGKAIHLLRVFDKFGELRGLRVRYNPASKEKLEVVASAMVEDFKPFETKPDDTMSLKPAFKGFPVAPDAGKDDDLEEPTSFGSGFLITSDGTLMTNAHVVAGCRRLYVANDKRARLLAIDVNLDLAIIKVAGVEGKPYASFSSDPARLGEDIAVFGFPLRTILADQLNMTIGSISSLAGMGGDPRHLQISAPVQQGNSGGPVLDPSGRVVGIVTSKLNALQIAEKSGDLPQSVNFAIRHDVALTFARRHGVEPTLAPRETPLARPDLASRAQEFTLPISCYGGS